MAYDDLKERHPARADREYLQILLLAAKETEAEVDEALRTLINEEKAVNLESVKTQLVSLAEPFSAREVKIDAVNLFAYDTLLEFQEAECVNEIETLFKVN